eukprot:TRINITY_DN327_c4_g1_i1.p1 TRINITY_DN327_c4_g1~~TRINITY_DN327_c4_g1_i1.p1  ORF type:complete len:242 (+),score=69.00 TRINITY_DN327_c4_g1_i1:60-785(+)
MASAIPAEAKGSVDWWSETMWNKGKMGWKAIEDEEWPFVENLKLCGVTESEAAGLNVLVPLCGDTAAVPVFAGMGMKVTAAEGSDKALAALRTRISDILKDDVEAPKRITILEGDFFKQMSEVPDNTFDLIYDRASMVALTPDMRQQYVDIMNRVAKPTCRMYFEGVMRNPEYTGEHALYPSNPDQVNIERGPPHHTTPEMVQKLYPSWDYTLDEKSLAKGTGVPPEVPFGGYRSTLSRKA